MHEPLEAFPHKDEQAAAVYINKAVERSIMEAPEQYMWLHRRFKTRQKGKLAYTRSHHPRDTTYA